MSSEQPASCSPAGEQAFADGFADALHARASGRTLAACQTWARLEAGAEADGADHLAIQAGAARALTLMQMGALSTAGTLTDELIATMVALEEAGAPLPAPPLSPVLIHAAGSAWYARAGLERLRAEQLRRGGDYAGAIAALERAAACSDQRPGLALPLWGRSILSDTIRLAGDHDGALEVARSARQRAEADPLAHPWEAMCTERSAARALLALGRLDEALETFERLGSVAPALAADPEAVDLGIGEILRRQGKHARARARLERARETAQWRGRAIPAIAAQLGLAELARAEHEPARVVLGILNDVQRQLVLAEHPWLRMRAYLLASLSSEPAQAERMIGRAEDELPRFHRRSCDLLIEHELLERCRVAVERGEAPDPIELDPL